MLTTGVIQEIYNYLVYAVSVQPMYFCYYDTGLVTRSIALSSADYSNVMRAHS